MSDVQESVSIWGLENLKEIFEERTIENELIKFYEYIKLESFVKMLVHRRCDFSRMA